MKIINLILGLQFLGIYTNIFVKSAIIGDESERNIYLDEEVYRYNRNIVTNNPLCNCKDGFQIDCLTGLTACLSDCNGLVRKAHEIDCIFPFNYNGVWYDTCINLDSNGNYWCSVDRYYNGKYAECSQECPLLARNLVSGTNEIHTSCKKTIPGWSGRYPTDSEINLILSEHNNIRANVSVLASDLKLLTWDLGLARLSLRLAETGIFSHDCGNCRKLLNNATIYNGQNLFYSGGIPYNNAFWSIAIAGWYNEVKYFRYGYGSTTGNWADVGHYTQIINNATVRIGCALAINQQNIIAVCNYANGQMGTEYPYTSGTPCTNCKTCLKNLCACNKICQNFGTLDAFTCTCNCMPYTTGDECQIKLCDKSDNSYGCWAPNSGYCRYSNILPICPHMCGICDFVSTF